MANEIDIARLKELASAATPGPWEIALNCNQAVWTRECVINAVTDNNASFIASASPDVVLALITDYQDKKEALYGLFLIINKLRDSLSLSKETELQEIVDFAVRHIERLEREADWLADYLVDQKICPTVKIYKCRYQEDKDYPRSECIKCWRDAVEKQCQSQ